MSVVKVCFSDRDIRLAVVQMEQKTQTPLQKENGPIVQKVMETGPRDSASLEPPLDSAKVHTVNTRID